LIANKPSSSVSDIDDAVNKNNSHSNKALLDTYTQTEANLADAVSKNTSIQTKQLSILYQKQIIAVLARRQQMMIAPKDMQLVQGG